MTGAELQLLVAVRASAMQLAARLSMVADGHDGAALGCVLGEEAAAWWAEQPGHVRAALVMSGEMARAAGVLKAS